MVNLAVVAYLKYYSEIWLQGLKKTVRQLRKATEVGTTNRCRDPVRLDRITLRLRLKNRSLWTRYLVKPFLDHQILCQIICTKN